MKKPKTLDEAIHDLHIAWDKFKFELFAPIKKMLLKIIKALTK